MRSHQNPRYHRQLAVYGIPDFPLHAEILAKQVEAVRLAPTPAIKSKLKACLERLNLPPQKRRGKHGCRLAICPICNSENSIRLIKKGAHFAYNRRLRGAHYTLVNPAQSTNAADIGSLQLQLIFEAINSALKKIQRALGPKFIAIAALEFTLDEMRPPPGVVWTAKAKKLAHRWSPHWHIIIICKNPELAEPYLAATLGASISKLEKRLVAKPSYTLGRHISYATKFVPERRAIVPDSNGDQDRKPRPLGDKRMKQLFAFLGDLPVSKRVLVLGNWKPTD